MYNRFSFCVGLVLAVRAFASDSDLFGGSSDESIFSDSSQALLPFQPESLDLPDLTTSQTSLGFDDAESVPSDSSIPSLDSPDAFSEASFAPLTIADCSSSDTPLFLNTGKSRLKRSSQCPNALDPEPVPSIPTIDDLDANLRKNILETYPHLGEDLRLSQDDDDDNSACFILTGGVMRRGACSNTMVDWNYIGEGSFPWNWGYRITIWDIYNVQPAPKQAMGCPEDLQYFVCCKDISIVAGNLMGLECAALEDFISSWPGGHTLP